MAYYDGWIDHRSVREGYWGPPTANTDWCEPNYQFTLYVAELFNTLSSVPICAFSLFGLGQCWKRGYELKFALSYTLVFIIGLGSVAFHGTLLRVGQVLDELPMLWASLMFLYVGMTLHGERPLLACCLFAWGCFCSLVYFQKGFDYFLITYAVTVAAVILNSVRTSLNSTLWPILKPWACSAGGLYAGGFLCLWVPEVLLCPSGSHVPVRSVAWTRHLQLHAWFHLSSSVGPYLFLVFSTFHRYHLLARRPAFVWRRPHPVLLLPMQVPVVKLAEAGSAR